MALDSKTQAALALHRFGLGPRAGSVAAIASDPRGALIAELDIVQTHYSALFENMPELSRGGTNMVFAGEQDDPGLVGGELHVLLHGLDGGVLGPNRPCQRNGEQNAGKEPDCERHAVVLR